MRGLFIFSLCVCLGFSSPLSKVKSRSVRSLSEEFGECLKPFVGSSGSGQCAPMERPEGCNEEAWWRLSSAFGYFNTVYATPPKYLSIEGHKACLKIYKHKTYQAYCLPQYQNEDCSDESWERLQANYDGIGCPLEEDEDSSEVDSSEEDSSEEDSSEEDSSEEGPTFGLGALPPAHLKLEDGQKDACLGTEETGSSTQLCLPRLRPEQCTDKSWDFLVNKFEGMGCSIESAGTVKPKEHQCLDTYQPPVKTRRQRCFPRQQPSGCSDEEWNRLAKKWQGPTCPAKLHIEGPEYLSIPGHSTCLLSYRGSNTHSEKCLPRHKLDACSPTAWEELQMKFKGLKCPLKPVIISKVDAGPPAYFSVVGHEKCITGTYPIDSYTVKCRPATRPSDCLEDAWTQLQSLFDGIDCPAEGSGLLSAGPPAYLSVPNFKDCLDDYKASDHHTELCMPAERPKSCLKDSWTALKEKFSGIGCPKRNFELIGGGSSVPPRYLSIEGHKACLSIFMPTEGSHKEYCLSHYKPPSCSEKAWQKLNKEFHGIECPPIVQVLLDEPPMWHLAIGAPEYLTVPNYRKCMGSHYPPGATHSELCLKAEKPEQCSQKSYDRLKEVFDGAECTSTPLLGQHVAALPPAYLSVEGHRDCLGSQKAQGGTHTELCLLMVKPEDCPQEAFEELQNTFEGDLCRGQVIGGDSLPPAHLQIEGHRDCLGTQQAEGGTHQELCVLFTKPNGCTQDVFEKVSEVFTGEPCRHQIVFSISSVGKPLSFPAYVSVAGFKDCLGTQKAEGGSHEEYCKLLEKPEACHEDSYKELSTAFDGDLCRMQITEHSLTLVGGPSVLPPAHLSVPGFKDCLGKQKVEGGTHTVFCLLLSKPDNCPEDSFDQLHEVFIGDVCRTEIIGGMPPSYLSVPKFDKCLETQQAESGTHEERCLPFEKPQECPQESYDQLLEVFEGGPCAPPLIGIGGMPPPYLSVPKFDKCLETQQAESGTHEERCLPFEKPEECPQESYDQLLEVFEGGQCAPPLIGIGGMPPPYLSVPHFDKCLGTQQADSGSHQERCLMFEKPEDCPHESFDQLLKIFDGGSCRPHIVGIGGVPPQYLSVPHLDKCLGTQQAEVGTHKERCLPLKKPEECPLDSYDQLIEIDELEDCVSGWIGQDTSTPDYLLIEGFRDCLGVEETDDGSSTVVCLYNDYGGSCSQETLEKLYELVGRDWDPLICENPITTVGAIPPKYLGVEGAAKCLKAFQVDTHQEKCLPADIPSECSEQAYQELLKIVFGEALKFDPVVFAQQPSYLTVTGWDDCLGVMQSGSSQVRCMLGEKPENCKDNSWTILANIFEGEQCKEIPQLTFSGGPFIGDIPDSINENSYPKKPCDTANDCSSSEFCHKTFTNAYCAPDKACSQDSECPPIGNQFIGVLSSSCSGGRCSYNEAELIT